MRASRVVKTPSSPEMAVSRKIGVSDVWMTWMMLSRSVSCNAIIGQVLTARDPTCRGRALGRVFGPNPLDSKAARKAPRPVLYRTWDGYSLRSSTSSILWLAPLVRIRLARWRVGRTFSCRLARLMSRQI